jgi:hypothetical protein
MQPKLRGTVTYISTPEGILFRDGDDYLPVKGKDIGHWFKQIIPVFDGRTSIEALSKILSSQELTVVCQLIEALKKAGMLYDAALDDLTALSDVVKQGYAMLLPRIEAETSQPLHMLNKARHTRVLIAGRAELAMALVDAGLESSLRQQTIDALDWDASSDEVLNALLRQHGAEKFGLRVDRIIPASDGSFGSSGKFDSVLIAGKAGADNSWIEGILDAVQSLNIPVFLLLVNENFVYSAELSHSSAAGCAFCLMDYYRDQSAPEFRISQASRTAGISIGSRLLIQRLFDLQSGILSEEDRLLFHELDLNTLTVTRHPLLRNSNCMRCRDSQKLAVGTQQPFSDRSAAKIETMPFLKRAEQSLVDAKTGLILQLDEGNLLQLPHHQSGALWRLPNDRSACRQITETGEDVYLARVAVFRRVLEAYITEELRGADPNSLVSVYGFTGNQAAKCPLAGLPPGVVISAINRQQAITEGFFRALARFAYNSNACWSSVELTSSLIGTDAELTLAYLDDTGMSKGISVQREASMSVDGRDVLRFDYEGQCISVVAGMQGPAIWTAGLKDIWLHITANEAFPPGGMAAPAVRFRCAEPSGEMPPAGPDLSGETKKLHLGLVALPSAKPMLAEPLSFYLAFISEKAIGI